MKNRRERRNILSRLYIHRNRKRIRFDPHFFFHIVFAAVLSAEDFVQKDFIFLRVYVINIVCILITRGVIQRIRKKEKRSSYNDITIVCVIIIVQLAVYSVSEV